MAVPSVAPPKSIRTISYLLLGLVAAAALEVIAGFMELRFLDSHDAEMQAKSTFLADAVRAADRMAGSATLALWAGAVGGIVFLLFRPLFLRAYVWARPVAWILVGLFFFTQILLMLQDGTVGIQPYFDMSHDLVQEKLINSLIVWPGYFLLEFPAEAAGLILPPLIVVQLLREDTVEFFGQRKKVTMDHAWEVEEILEQRRAVDNGAHSE
jgi:hypothetical protein